MVQATVETLAVGQTSRRDDTIAGRAVAARRPRVQGATRPGGRASRGLCGGRASRASAGPRRPPAREATELGVAPEGRRKRKVNPES